MNSPLESTITRPGRHVGILGLPSGVDCMISGGLYALIAKTPPARYPILSASLGAAAREDIACTLIVAQEPGQFIRRLEAHGDLPVQQLFKENRLRLYVLQDEFSKQIFRFGADSFVRELDHFEVPTDSYLIFDQADELLSLHDISLATAQVEILAKWARQRSVTVLLVFSGSTEAHSSVLNSLMDHFSGIARLDADKSGLELTFDYWESPDQISAARHYRLDTLESGLYEVSTQVTSQAHAQVQTPATARYDFEPQAIQPHSPATQSQMTSMSQPGGPTRDQHASNSPERRRDSPERRRVSSLASHSVAPLPAADELLINPVATSGLFSYSDNASISSHEGRPVARATRSVPPEEVPTGVSPLSLATEAHP